MKRLIIQILSIAFFIFGLINAFPIVMTALLLLSIVGGAFHCGWVCPFGTLQEYVRKLGKKFNIKQIKVNRILDTTLKSLRYILFIVFTLFTISLLFDMFVYEPRENFNILLTKQTVTKIGLLIVLIFTFLSIFIERFYCRYLCIEGAKHGILSLIRPYTIHRNDTCINCKKCDNNCPMNIEVSTVSDLRSPSCINCQTCIDVCPVENTLTYRFIKPSILNIVLYIILIGLIAYSYIEFDTLEPITSSVALEEETQLYLNGSYEGKAMGFRGDVTVSVTFDQDKITSISVIDHREDMKWYNRAKTVLELMLSKQSADVDTVSGATYTSRAMIEAVNNAIEKAKK